MRNNLSDELMAFIDENPTPYHVVENSKKMLEKAGFVELDRTAPWKLKKSSAYFTIYSDTSIIAFRTPSNLKDSAVAIIGAHTDSPNLRVKQGAEKLSNGYLQTPVEVYGGVLVNSWMDRDLSIAGRVHIKKKSGIHKQLFFINKPVARVSQLAIHLNREVNDKGLSLNTETEIVPDFGLAKNEDSNEFLKNLLANEIKCKPEDIITYEVSFANCQKACYGGYNEDFIHSGRLDNQAMCHAGLKAIINSDFNNNFNVIALFDHEEVGSRSAAGADSNILKNLIDRMVTSFYPEPESLHQISARSFMISADMAHAVHSNFAAKHGGNRPLLNKGVVFKFNSSQRYATDGSAMAKMSTLCNKNNIPYQVFYNRTDLPCGTTIGPISSSSLTYNTVDLGNPMLSMHSSRESCGSEDHPNIIKLFQCFFNQFIEEIKD